MVNIGKVRMGVRHRFVPMRVRVGARIGSRRIVRVVLVPVMVVVNVSMRVVEQLMVVFMLMSLGEMQPDTYSHETRRDDERDRRTLAIHDQR